MYWSMQYVPHMQLSSKNVWNESIDCGAPFQIYLEGTIVFVRCIIPDVQTVMFTKEPGLQFKTIDCALSCHKLRSRK